MVTFKYYSLDVDNNSLSNNNRQLQSS